MKALLFVLLFPAVAFAAPGDAIYIVDGGTKTLSTAEKLTLSSAVSSVFSVVPIATLDKYYCFSAPDDPVNVDSVDLSAMAASAKYQCRAIDVTTATADEAFSHVLAGKLPPSAMGSGNTVKLRYNSPAMDSDAKTLNGAFTQEVFSTQLSFVWDFGCIRDGSDIKCRFTRVKVESVDQFKTDYKAGLVLKPIGRVAP